MFEELETFCTKHGVDFDRKNDGRYEINAEWVMGRGRKKPVSTTCNQNEEPVIEVAALREILDSRQSPAKKTEAINKLLDPAPALDPLTITDQETS